MLTAISSILSSAVQQSLLFYLCFFISAIYILLERQNYCYASHTDKCSILDLHKDGKQQSSLTIYNYLQ